MEPALLGSIERKADKLTAPGAAIFQGGCHQFLEELASRVLCEGAGEV